MSILRLGSGVNGQSLKVFHSGTMGKHVQEPDGADAAARAEADIPGRIWLGLSVVLTLLSRRSPDHPPGFLVDAVGPAPSDAPTVADLLDRIGRAVARAWCWMEAKLGLQPKD